MKFSSFSTKLALAASVAAVMTGCDDPDYPTPTPSTQAGQGRVIVVNAAPGAGDAQVSGIDNAAPSPAIAAIPYLSASSYTNLNAGQRLLTFGTATNLNNNQIFLRNGFTTNTNTTVFLTDPPTRAASGSDQGGVRTLVLADNLAAPATATNAKIRFVNLAPSGTYGIFNSLTNASLFSAIPTRAFRAVSATASGVTTTFANFTEVPAGTYTLDVRSTASTPIVGTQQVVTLAAGKIYTLYTRGVAGNTATPLGISTVLHN